VLLLLCSEYLNAENETAVNELAILVTACYTVDLIFVYYNSKKIFFKQRTK